MSTESYLAGKDNKFAQVWIVKTVYCCLLLAKVYQPEIRSLSTGARRGQNFPHLSLKICDPDQHQFVVVLEVGDISF